jgi:hypothetical protein
MMTESEWVACTDPQKMLEFLRGKASERKLRLFACSCCDRLEELCYMENEELLAIEIAELYADGRATHEDPASARNKVWTSGGNTLSEENRSYAMDCVTAVPLSEVNSVANCIIEQLENHHHWTEAELEAEQEAERVLQCEILRDFFGNPFRPVAIAPSWLTWNDGTVPRLAQAIYDERAFDRLPILADALEEAGCDNAEVLNHLRGPGQHVRGCWVVDLCMNKG